MNTTRSVTDQVATDDNNVHIVLRSLDSYKFEPSTDNAANAGGLHQLLTTLPSEADGRINPPATTSGQARRVAAPAPTNTRLPPADFGDPRDVTDLRFQG